MKILFALGNPGSQYQNSRHNVGWQVADTLIGHQDNGTFQPKTKFFAEIAEFSRGNEKVVVAKPTTFYNETGTSARALMDFYKVSLNDILVIHDDTMLDFGKIRLRHGGQDAGNNGLKSLHQHIGTDFWHIRIGTDSLLRRQIGDVDFVLGHFNQDEMKILADWTIPTAIEIIWQFIDGNPTATTYRLQ